MQIINKTQCKTYKKFNDKNKKIQCKTSKKKSNAFIKHLSQWNESFDCIRNCLISIAYRLMAKIELQMENKNRKRFKIIFILNLKWDENIRIIFFIRINN